MTTQLYVVGSGAVTVREPDADGYGKRQETTGASARALDGTLRQHYVALKQVWTLKWTGLTSSERDTLKTELDRAVPMTFKPPDTATTYTVLRIGPVEEASDGYSYGLAAVLEQV